MANPRAATCVKKALQNTVLSMPFSLHIEEPPMDDISSYSSVAMPVIAVTRDRDELICVESEVSETK